MRQTPNLLMDYWRIRSDFPLLSRYTYLDTASSGAISEQTYRAMMEFVEGWLKDGENWERVIRDVVEARRLFAEMVGIGEDEVALVPNASTGLVAVASSIKLKEDSNIVAAEHNFPTNLNIWASMRRSGMIKEVRIARYRGRGIPVDEYERLVDDSTALVSADMVGWLTGYREDLKALAELAHRHGAILVSDIFHAAGVVPLDLKRLGVDAAVCGSYKWLLGPSGAGFLYIRRELLDAVFEPRYVGWMGVRDSVVERMSRGEERLFERPLPLLDAEPSKSTSRYEWGSWSGPSVVGFAESLRYFARIGVEWIWRRIKGLTSMLIEGLEELGIELYSPVDDERRAGIVSLRVGDSYTLAEKLAKDRIIVSARPNLLRISVHFYNNEEDMERILGAFRRMRDSML